MFHFGLICVSGSDGRVCVCMSVLFISWHVFTCGRSVELDDVSDQMLMYCSTT